MTLGLTWGTLLLGVLVFLARVLDVSVGTMRTISIVQGKTRLAFFLGLIEVSVWLVVVATVVNKVMQQPILGVFYAFGFSTGNVVGIKLERRIAFGHTVLRVITPERGEEMAAAVRGAGYPVTTFTGQGMAGPVMELYIVSRRRDLRRLVPIILDINPNAFYITEQAGSVSKLRRPFMTPRTDWRAIFKKK
ncbi:MAG: DUF2179 domain-containing protein [Candidatus Latescibacterota bacterium]|nr:MAG: DUF2179 domain-containing protein [Candidatus Latescibacterota bacterium]